MSIKLNPVPQGAMQVDVPVNDSFEALQALVQAGAEATTNTPPATSSADVSKAWIVGTTPTDAWAGRASNIALCVAPGIWRFFVPANGWLVKDRTAGSYKTYDGSSWSVFSGGGGGGGSFDAPSYLSGLMLSWNNTASITVSSGEAYVESVAAILQSGASITKSGLSLSPSAWYHVYLFSNTGTPDIELSATAPAAPYRGTARSKTGDESRRYLGSVRTDSSGNLYRFQHAGNQVTWLEPQGSAPFLLVANGTATTATNINCADLVPLTARVAQLSILNYDPDLEVLLANADSNATVPSSYLLFIFRKTASVILLPLDSSQRYSYAYNGFPTLGSYHRLLGYFYER